MATALDVAQFFIANGANSEEGISNLKIQKLLYYAQGFYLAVYGKPLFDEELEAWTHGPVVPSVYHHYKCNGSSPIPRTDYDVNQIFTDEEKEFLGEVHTVFGQFSAWKLRNMTHEERPWLESEESASVISKVTMLEYFRTRLK